MAAGMLNVQHSNLYDTFGVVCIGASENCSCFFPMMVRAPLSFIDFLVQGPFHGRTFWGIDVDFQTDPFLVEVCACRRNGLRHWLG